MQLTTHDWTSGSRSFGWPALAAAIAAHLLVFYFLDGLIGKPGRDRSIAEAVTLHLLPAPQPTRPAPRHVPKAALQPAEKLPHDTTRGKDAAPVPPRRPPVEKAATPATRNESESLPAVPTANGDSIARFKRDAGNIDRDMRSKAPKLLEGPANTVQARLEKGVGNAVRPASSVMVEKLLPDGRRVTKFAAPDGGSYCVTRDGAGATDGLDPFTQGGKNKVTNCGHLFD